MSLQQSGDDSGLDKAKALDELAKAKSVLMDYTEGEPLSKGWTAGEGQDCLCLWLVVIVTNRPAKKKRNGRATTFVSSLRLSATPSAFCTSRPCVRQRSTCSGTARLRWTPVVFFPLPLLFTLSCQVHERHQLHEDMGPALVPRYRGASFGKRQAAHTGLPDSQHFRAN